MSSENGGAVVDDSSPVRLKSSKEIVDAAVAKHWDATKNEAGRPEGRTVPELVLGPQRYPDPSIWRPDDIKGSLLDDKGYKDVTDFIYELDNEK